MSKRNMSACFERSDESFLLALVQSELANFTQSCAHPSEGSKSTKVNLLLMNGHVANERLLVLQDAAQFLKRVDYPHRTAEMRSAVALETVRLTEAIQTAKHIVHAVTVDALNNILNEEA